VFDVSAPPYDALHVLIDKESSSQNFHRGFATPGHSKQRKAQDTMAQRAAVRTTYEVERTLQPIYSGGSLSLSEDGRILAASLGEDVLLTDLTSGKELGRVEGDGEVITALSCGFLPSCA
jgi:WD40 repeat protein